MIDKKIISFILILYLFFTLGYLFSTGFYNFAGFAIIFLSFSLLFLLFIKENFIKELTQLPDSSVLLSLILTVSLSLQAVLHNIEGQLQAFSSVSRFLLSIALAISLTFFLKKIHPKIEKIRFLTILTIILIVQVLAIIAAPSPSIDVFYSIRDGVKTFLEGNNPYLLEQTSIYGVYAPKIIYVYGIAPLFLFVPFVLIFNDPRLLYPIVNLANAFLLWRISKNYTLSLVYLAHPMFPFIVNRSWIEPLILTFLFFMIERLNSKIKDFYSYFSLIMIGLTKFFYFLPILFLSRKLISLQRSVLILIFTLVLYLPFFIWDKVALSKRAFYFLQDPDLYSYQNGLSRNSLNFHGLLFRNFGIDVPNFIHVLAVGIVLGIIFLKIKPSLFNYCLALSLSFLALFLLTPFTFFNYYFFVGSLLLATVAIGIKKRL